jgi:DUF4097 and DUF4098 domain-containing protein YvlB
MKDQARAQKLAFRTQRELYRQQARAMRRTSIVGPLLIIGVGVIILLIHLGRLSWFTFESFYGRWWPLLLVAAGLILAAEWAFDHHNAQSGSPYVRRGIGGGVIFLLILLALTGASIDGFRDGVGVLAKGLHVDSDDFGQFLGDRHDFTQQIDQVFPANASLTVDNPHGDVTITGASADNQIHVVVNKQVYTWGDDNASNRADQLAPRLATLGQNLSISVPQLDSGSADLAITLPASAQVTVTAGHGAVTISDLAAPVNVTANHGDVELDRIAATVVARANSGSSFSAHDIHGDVTLHGHADDLNLTGVAGAVSLEGEFFGDTHLEHLAGPVTFHTNRTQFSVAALDGMVDISNDSEMTGDQLVGPVELTTRSRNISFERVAGEVTINNSNGTVDLTNSAPVGNISVDNTNGEVTLTVPDPSTAHAGFTIQTGTKDGAIEDELDGSSVADDPSAVHTATIGNGVAHITLHTTHADITLHKGFVEPPSAPPPPPAPPTAPSPPAKPQRGSKPPRANARWLYPQGAHRSEVQIQGFFASLRMTKFGGGTAILNSL